MSWRRTIEDLHGTAPYTGKVVCCEFTPEGLGEAKMHPSSGGIARTGGKKGGSLVTSRRWEGGLSVWRRDHGPRPLDPREALRNSAEDKGGEYHLSSRPEHGNVK